MSTDQQYREKVKETYSGPSASYPVKPQKQKQSAADFVNTAVWFAIAAISFLSLTVDLWYTKVPFFASHNITEWMVGLGGALAAFLLFLLTPQFPEFRRYLKGVLLELRKIIWPSKNETLRTTWIVLLVVAVSAAFLSSVDWIFAKLIQTVIR